VDCEACFNFLFDDGSCDGTVRRGRWISCDGAQQSYSGGGRTTEQSMAVDGGRMTVDGGGRWNFELSREEERQLIKD
jgi:hypothetical protein